MATWGPCLGAVALTAAGVFAPFPFEVLTSTAGSAPVWGLALYVGLVGMAGAIALGAIAQRVIPSTSASLIAALEIVVGGVQAALVLGERLSAAQWTGSAAMLTGIVLSQLAVARRGAPVQEVRAVDPVAAGMPR